MFCHNIKDYVKRCKICQALKVVWHKLYYNLQSFLIFTHRWKDLLIDFVTRLLILTNWKGNSYDSILVIIDRLTKIVYYKSVKVIINALGLAKVIINVVVRHYNFARLNYHQPEVIIHLKVLIIAMLFFKYQVETFHHLPSTDRQTDKEAK